MNWPSLSVIIPSYNQGQYIERTLLSILKQDYPGPVQVIVSDGGSTDSTLDVLKKYPQVVWWSAKDRGFVDAVNKGLAKATGEIVAIQSSDDYYLEGAFRKAIGVLMHDPRLVFVTGNDVLLSDSAPPSFPPAKPYRVLTDPGSLINKTVFDHVPQHCTFVRRSAIDRVSGLREEVDLCADFDLWYRVLHFGKAVMLPDYLAVYQEHAAQRTKNNAGLWINALKKVIEDAEANPEYAQRFVPTPDVKRNIFLQWTLFWNKIAGGEQGIQVARALSKETLEHPDLWPDYVIGTVRQYGLDPKPFSTAQKLVRALKRNDMLRSFAGKPVFSRYAIAPDLQVLDIGWWRGKDRTSLLKTVALRTAAVVVLSAVQALLVNSKKPSSVAKKPSSVATQAAGTLLGIADAPDNTEGWPSLSVIIPSYNQGQYLERTLLSILKQDYPGSVQVIVSDGGSTDSTLDVLKKYPQVVWWSAKDRGFADAVNKGLAKATGEIVAIQSSDDYYLEGAFRTAIGVLMHDPSLAFVTGNDLFVMEGNKHAFNQTKPYVTMLSPGSLIAGSPALYVPQHCTFVRRSAINQVGSLREDVDYCADFDLWYRVLHFGKAVMLPDFLAAYQMHPSQRTQNKADLFIRVHKQVVEDAEANPEYAQRFVPQPEIKRSRFRHWEAAWNFVAGGEQGIQAARAIARETLQHPGQWSSYVLDSMRGFVADPPVLTRGARLRELVRAVKRNDLLRSFAGRPVFSRYAVTAERQALDLGWWRGKDRTSLAKTIVLRAAVVAVLSAAQAVLANAKKPPSIAPPPADVLDAVVADVAEHRQPDNTEGWPSLSVIIPSYNQGQYLERTLLSILKQDYPGSVQVIVSDGGSTDSTLDVLKKYPQVVWWSAKDRGFADAVNKGLAQATGEIVAIQSSDDYYLEGAFRKAIGVLMHDPSLAFVTGADITLEENGYASTLPKPYVTLQNPGSLISRTPWLYVPQHTTFLRRTAINQVDGLREEVDRCADFDLWYRVLHFGKAVMLADYLAVYQRHAAQRTQNKADLWIAAHKKVVEDAEANPKYARRYVPASNHKRDIFLMWEALWNSLAGGEAEAQKARVLAENALSQPGQWPDYVADYLTPFRDAPPPPSKYLNSRWGKALKHNRLVRALAGKPPLRKPVSNVPSDIHWWAKGKPTTSPARASKKALPR